MSAGLNTVAGVLYEDFLSKFLPNGKNEKIASFVMKITVVVTGLLCVALVRIIENLNSITQVSFSLGAIQNGASFAVFALGLFCPWTNTKVKNAYLYSPYYVYSPIAFPNYYYLHLLVVGDIDI